MATCTDWLMYLLWNYLLCGTPRASRGHEIRWGYANTRLPRFEGGIMPSMLNAEKVMTPDIRQKFFASLNECTRFANQDGCMPSLGVVMRPERPSFGWFINGDRCDRCQSWAPNRFAGLRLSRARWVLPHMTAKNWEAVTTRNKCPIVCYTTSQAVLHDWLFRRDLRPHRNHLGSDCRCRFRACTADRPSCSQKSTRLKSLFQSS